MALRYACGIVSLSREFVMRLALLGELQDFFTIEINSENSTP